MYFIKELRTITEAGAKISTLKFIRFSRMLQKLIDNQVAHPRLVETILSEFNDIKIVELDRSGPEVVTLEIAMNDGSSYWYKGSHEKFKAL